MFEKIAFLASLLLVGACTSQKLNSGAIDYRIFVVAQNDSCKKTKAEETKTGVRRYYGPNEFDCLDRLKAHEAVSIRILQVFICDFAESSEKEAWGIFDNKKKKKRIACNQDGNSNAETKGEIAIVADVFEQGDKKIEYRTGTTSSDRGRVIYYSEDIEETGQYFNLSNIPMYGPVEYLGKPLFLRFFIIELDEQETKQLSSTLKKLAGLATKAYPPGSEILGVLNGLGEAFLSGSQDDMELDYVMAFDGAGGVATSYAPLAVGTYAFVRKERRDSSFDWSTVKLDENSGRLVTCDEEESTDEAVINSAALPKPRCQEYRSETYFTMKVVKNEPAISNESTQLMSEFKTQAEADIQERDFAALTTAVDVLADSAEKAVKFDAARSKLAILGSEDSNPIECTLALEAYLEGVCSLSLQPDDKGIDRARYLLSEIYDIYGADPKTSCAAKVANVIELDEKKLTVSNLRKQCPSDDAEERDYIAMWQNFGKT